MNSRLMPGCETSHIGRIDPRALLAVTLFYLLMLLSIPIFNLEKTIWFAAYPIVTAPLAHLRYEKILAQSLYLLPILLLIALFNPLIDKREVFEITGFTVSYGWISAINIVLRGLFAFQALLLLINIVGFFNICYGLQRMGLPEILTVQLLFLYRYLGTIIEEALKMHNARIARGYGKTSYPMKLWGRFVGTLLIRSYERAGRIHKAMVARGFQGKLYSSNGSNWDSSDTLYCFVWMSILLFLRFANISDLIRTIIIEPNS